MSRRLIHRTAVVVVRIAFEEDLVEMPGALLGDLQPFVFARGPVVGDGALVHVAHVVQFVAVDDPGVGRLAHLLRPGDSADVRDVQIAIVLLGLGDHVDDFVQLLFEGGIGFDHQQIGGSLHHLVQIRRNEAMGKRQFAASTMQEVAAAAEIFHRRLGLFQRVGNGRFGLELEPGQPEVVLQRHFLEGHRRKWIIVLLVCRQFAWQGSEEDQQPTDMSHPIHF